MPPADAAPDAAPDSAPDSAPDAALRTGPNIADQDGFYAALLAAHAGLSESESHAFNARLILILANHVGDDSALREALALAKASA